MNFLYQSNVWLTQPVCTLSANNHGARIHNTERPQSQMTGREASDTKRMTKTVKWY